MYLTLEYRIASLEYVVCILCWRYENEAENLFLRSPIFLSYNLGVAHLGKLAARVAQLEEH